LERKRIASGQPKLPSLGGGIPTYGMHSALVELARLYLRRNRTEPALICLQRAAVAFGRVEAAAPAKGEETRAANAQLHYWATVGMHIFPFVSDSSNGPSPSPSVTNQPTNVDMDRSCECSSQ
jgi:hypothetical protein